MKKFRRKIKVVKLAAAELGECIAVISLIEPDAEYNLLDCVEAQMLAYRDYECAVSGFSQFTSEETPRYERKYS